MDHAERRPGLVDDLMRGVKAVSDSRTDPGCDAEIEALVLFFEGIPDVGGSSTVEELHRNEAVHAADAVLERLDHVWMGQSCEELRLVDEHRPELLVMNELVADHLQ